MCACTIPAIYQSQDQYLLFLEILNKLGYIYLISIVPDWWKGEN